MEILKVETPTAVDSCCQDLNDALRGDGFEPLITVAKNHIIYLTVGLMRGEESLVDHPLFFCPFCGTKLQTPEAVEERSKAPVEEEIGEPPA